ncbi:MAG: TolC family protein [Geobacter sp.]|nr:MAG: TolC family protein [Geobacter sp.]
MKMRVGLFVISSALLLNTGFARAADALPPENLSNLVASALANNPELKSSDARWQMFRNRIIRSRSFDDPMLMLKIQNGLINDPLNFHKDSMTQKVIGISQQIPFWGKRGLKGEVAEREAESYKWQVEERKLELKRMVAETYYQLYFTDKSREIVDKNIKILDDFVTIAESKYSVGQGTQQDVFKAQVERSKILDMRITLEQQRKSLQSSLNALLFRPADTPVGTIPDFDIPPLALSRDDLRGRARENRPLLKSLNALIEKGKAVHKLAEKEYYPDFNVAFEYMQRDRSGMDPGDDMYSLGVTFNLPLQRKLRQATVAESSSEVTMANEELNSLNNSIDAGISDLVAQLERRRKLAELYKTGIIPQSEQSLESAVIGYRVSKVDFLTLLDNRLTLFNNERELYDSLADYQMKLAQLEAVVGIDLNPAPPGPAVSPSGGPEHSQHTEH